MKIDINKKYRTRDGREVTLLHRAPEGWPDTFPWRGIITPDDAGTWRDNGQFTGDGSESQYDLIEVRQPREFEIWIHPNGGTQRHEPCCSGWQGPIRVREIID